jgi:hypothetical protein
MARRDGQIQCAREGEAHREMKLIDLVYSEDADTKAGVTNLLSIDQCIL